MRRVASLVLLAAACGSPASEPTADADRGPATPGAAERAAPPADPAGVRGGWDYRTQSNCGSVDGVGELLFDWDASGDRYRERGCVYWADSGNTIYWWGHPSFVASTRRLEGRNQNSLGDYVDGGWELVGPGPDRLVVRWDQTNGCHGQGTATRRGPATAPGSDPARVAGAAYGILAAWFETRDGQGSSPCDASRAGPELWPGPSSAH